MCGDHEQHRDTISFKPLNFTCCALPNAHSNSTTLKPHPGQLCGKTQSQSLWLLMTSSYLHRSFPYHLPTWVLRVPSSFPTHCCLIIYRPLSRSYSPPAKAKRTRRCSEREWRLRIEKKRQKPGAGNRRLIDWTLSTRSDKESNWNYKWDLF